MMSEKIMRSLTPGQPQSRNQNSVSSVPLKRSRHISENNRKKSDRNEKQVKPFSPKSSLDQVAEDIENILGKLNVFSAGDLKKSKPIELKIVQKQFFTTNGEVDRKKEVPQKSNTSNSKGKAKVKHLSNSPMRSDTGKKKPPEAPPKTITVINSNSSNMIRKVPVTKSELQNFKHKIILNSNRVFKAPEKIKYQDKERIAKNVRRLIEAALKESEHNRKPPVINVENFIRQSLMSIRLQDDHENTKRTEKKTIDSYNGSSVVNDFSLRLRKYLMEGSKLNIGESENQQINKLKQSQLQEENEQDFKMSENESTETEINLCYPVVKTIKTTPNDGYTSSGSTKNIGQARPKSNGNTVNHRKVPPSRSSVNITRKSLPKVSSKQSNNKTTLPQNSKRISNKNSLVVESNKKINPVRSKTRSNSTLNTINISPSDKTSLNKVINMDSRPSSANSANLSKMGGITRRGSSYGEMKSRISQPKRISSSISSKGSNGKRVSSMTCYSRTRSMESTTRRLNNPLKQLRDEVNRAIREKKTFTLRGNHTAVRKALLKRGWVERYHITNTEKLENQMYYLRRRSMNELEDMMHVKELNDVCRKLIKSKLLANHQVDLYWGPNYDSFTINPDHVKLTKINKFRRDVFSYTSKQGLCIAAKDAHWFNFPGLANIKHPRTYVLAINGETNDFIKDFRRTAAISLMKWVIRSYREKDCKIVSNSGKVPLEVFQFAANECCKIVIEANNEDIDQPLKEASNHEWDQFLEYYYKILHIGNHFKLSNLETEESIVDKSMFILKKLSPHYPHMKMDGTMNIWILKPALGSQGKGIHICRTLKYILQTVKNNNNIRYIAQKYIERPLLIFNTKFDIRQWFLISSAVPLTIWMYKECYLRFSSQTYNLRKLHESIHLTNNSVQQRYQNTSRDITLPNYNMWDSQQFRNYLSNIGFPDVYHEVTYKGMKECIIGAVLIHQDKIDKRKNSFELYGADFMLTEDFQPWLIEINSSPALYASTPVTSRMCPQVLEDTIKVVVDYASNPKAKTGNFELIYKQDSLLDKNNACVKDLKVSGKPLPSNYFCSDEEKNENNGEVIENFPNQIESPRKEQETESDDVKETLQKLLKFIHNEKKRRQKRKLIAKGTDPIDPFDKLGQSLGNTFTNKTKSIGSLKSQWDALSGKGSISVAKEDITMIDKALSMLKETKNGEIIGYLLEVIEKILSRTQQNKVVA